MNREETQKLYIRVCKDSGFKMDYIEAAKLTAKIIGIHPIEIWCALPSLQVMEQIAKGEHPAALRVAA